MQNFKIDLPMLMRAKVLDDLSIRLIETVEDVIRIPVSLNITGGYMGNGEAATYDIMGTQNCCKYIIRCYCRIGSESIISKHVISNNSQVPLKNVYAYNVYFSFNDIAKYKLQHGFPVIDNTVLTPELFCGYIYDPEKYIKQDGTPLCVIPRYPPVITLTNGPSVRHRNNIPWRDPGYVATDVQDGDITAIVETLGDTIDNDNLGTFTIVYTVTNSYGLSATVEREVEVYHVNEPPIIKLNAFNGMFTPVYLDENDTYTDPGATAYDLEDGDLTNDIVVSGDTIDMVHGGTFYTRYQVTDSGGLVSSVERTIVVSHVDRTPIITLAAHSSGGIVDISIPKDSIWVDPGFTATDFEDGDLTSSVIVSGEAVDSSMQGTYIIRYEVTDRYGNVGRAERHVTIAMPPVITLNQPHGTLQNPVNVQYNSTWVEPGYSAYDIEDGDLTSSVVVSGTVNTLSSGDYIINYDVTDSSGLTAHKERIVRVAANGAPTINLVGSANITIANGGTWVDPGATATDAEDNNLTSSIVVSGDTVDVDTEGNYIITYTVTDSGGLSASVSRVVTVGPYNSIPTISIVGPQNVTVAYGDIYTDAGATAVDTEDGDLTPDIVVSGDTVDTSTAGTYHITYTVTDSGGLSASTTKTVTVTDPAANTPPNITITGSQNITIPFGGTYTDAGATANDAEDGDLTNNIIVSGDTVDTNTSGTYDIVYTVTDSGGLSATATRHVTVEAATGPTLTLTGDDVSMPEQTIVWWFKPKITSNNVSHYIHSKYLKLINASGQNIITDTAVAVMTDEYTSHGSGREYIDSQKDVSNIPSLNQYSIVWYDVSSEKMGWYAEGNTTSPVTKFVYSKQPIYVPPEGMDIYYASVDGGVGNDNLQTAIEAMSVSDWTLAYTTPPSVNFAADPYTFIYNIDLPSAVTPEYKSFTEPGFTATSASGADISSNVVVTSNIVPNTPGTYTVTYSITDAGETVTKTRTVTVEPGYTPLDIHMDLDYNIVGDGITMTADYVEWHLPFGPLPPDRVTAIDPIDGDISANVTWDSALPTTAGTFVRTCSVTNSRGYTSIGKQNILVHQL